jgi:BlaI family transcriptional regulator, penicillinase repressor
MSLLSFGRMQRRIMQILWQRGKANAREITERLNRDQFTAHSTVQTLLRQLETKGAIAHEVQDRTFVFYPLVEEHTARRSATRDLIERVFGGSVGGLMAHLLQHEKIPRKELQQLRQLVEKTKEG